jgi:hypothetical protein
VCCALINRSGYISNDLAEEIFFAQQKTVGCFAFYFREKSNS